MILYPHLTLHGDNGNVPDAVVVIVNPMDGSQGPVQRTLIRGTDDGWKFWLRIAAEARALVFPLGRMSRVDVFCKYGDMGALPPDERVNYRRALMHVMQFDPSHRQRVNAAGQLLDMHARTLQ